MVALLVFMIYNGFFGDCFWPKKTVGRKRSIQLFGGDVFKNPVRDIDYEEHVS